MTGRLYVGTSGFGYPAWVPRFYPPGTRTRDLLPAYAARLPAVELNGTFYRMPKPAIIEGWIDATPAHFRFVLKALRSGSMRAWATDPVQTLPWLLAPALAFRERLGTVLFRVGAEQPRSDERLDRLLSAWPADLPLVLEFQDPSWEDDAVHARLRAAGAALCATDQPEADEPMLRRTGPLVYVRLRRDDYAPEALDTWARRLEPFLGSGTDAFVFFKHDPVGRGGELALELATRLESFLPR